MYNPFSLSGKTVLVTGASSGIGRATAIECSKMGATVVLTARNEERLQETLRQLEGEGHRYIVADLTDEEAVCTLVRELPLLEGAVLNAGIMGLAPVVAITAAKLEQMQRINLNAPILLTRQLARQKKLANGASIVFMASAAGVYRTSAGNAIYATTKSGLDAFMRTAALELAGKGIRCNSVNPAMTETEAIAAVQDAAMKEKDLANYPLRRYGRPEEVAQAAVYLLSDTTRWMTGTALKIDGGRTLI
ncbi:MAG: SDR family oxidoreductase [Paludibacteraceae bacterium]|nr:SDR family oxidoreductase [Paludibacteraceae bacterium]